MSYMEKMEKTHVRSPQQGDVQNAQCGTPIIQETTKRTKGIQVCHKPIQPLRHKQVYGQGATYRVVACLQHESVTQK